MLRKPSLEYAPGELVQAFRNLPVAKEVAASTRLGGHRAVVVNPLTVGE